MKKTIFEIPNPFDYTRPVIYVDEFAGRAEEIEEINKIFDNIKNDLSINLAIFGERACGKTSLLNFLVNKARSKNGLAVKIDLNENIIKSDIDFFVEIIDKIIEEGIPKNLLGGENSEYYLSWRRNVDEFYYNDDITKDFLRIGRIYAASKRGEINSQLRESVLEKDLQSLINDANNNNIDFISVFIDEADIFQYNKGLLQIIRNLIQKLTKIIFVLAGTEKMFDYLDDVFSPIPRQFKKIKLTNFRKITETIDCIFKPIEKQGIERNTIWNYISLFTIVEIHTRTEGNPYHIKLISHYVFDEFIKSKDSNKELKINHNVLERVFGDIFRHSTREGRQINELLHKCSHEELKDLAYLLRFCNLTIIEAAYAINFEDKMEENNIIAICENILRIFNRVKYLGLIQLLDSQKKELKLENIDISNENYFNNLIISFNGDELDILFIDYYLQDKLDNFVRINVNQKYEDIMLSFMMDKVYRDYKSFITNEFGVQELPIINPVLIDKSKDPDKVLNQPLLELYSKLLNLIEVEQDYGRAYELGLDLGLNDVINYLEGGDFCNIFQIYGTIRDSYFNIRIFQKLNSYFTKDSDNEVFNENKLIKWEQTEYILYSNREEKSFSLDNYQIKIKSRDSIILNGSIIEKLAYIDLDTKVNLAVEETLNGNYKNALDMFRHINKIKPQCNYLNNQGFVELLLNDLENAEITFKEVLKINRSYYTTIFNMGYILYRKNKWKEAEEKFREAERLCKRLTENERQHLLFKIPLLEYSNPSNKTDIDLIKDPDILVLAYCSLALICSRTGRKPNAYAFLNNAKKLNKHFHLIKRIESYVEFYLGNKEKAIQLNNELIRTKDEELECITRKQIEFDTQYFNEN